MSGICKVQRKRQLATQILLKVNSLKPLWKFQHIKLTKSKLCSKCEWSRGAKKGTENRRYLLGKNRYGSTCRWYSYDGSCTCTQVFFNYLITHVLLPLPTKFITLPSSFCKLPVSLIQSLGVCVYGQLANDSNDCWWTHWQKAFL